MAFTYIVRQPCKEPRTSEGLIEVAGTHVDEQAGNRKERKYKSNSDMTSLRASNPSHLKRAIPKHVPLNRNQIAEYVIPRHPRNVEGPPGGVVHEYRCDGRGRLGRIRWQRAGVTEPGK